MLFSQCSASPHIQLWSASPGLSNDPVPLNIHSSFFVRNTSLWQQPCIWVVQGGLGLSNCFCRLTWVSSVLHVIACVHIHLYFRLEAHSGLHFICFFSSIGRICTRAQMGSTKSVSHDDFTYHLLSSILYQELD